MRQIWSNRPPLLRLGLFIVAYMLGAGFAQALAIVPGTGISIWPPSGLFIATLVYTSRYSWPWWVAAGCLAEMFSNSLWFFSPLPAAFLIYTGNALEAVVGAWLVNWACGRPVRLETVREVIALVVLGAGVAPVASATVGSATLAWFGIKSQAFTAAWPLFWLGDATGILIVAPLALVLFQNWGGRTTQLSAARWIEACILGVIFLGVAALSLTGHLASAYVVMPPLLWAAVRFELKGAAVALTLLALITVIFTVSGASQFVGDPEFQRQLQYALQLFLAISAFSVLIVAAISRQHQQAVLTLRQSVEALRGRERELSLLVDMVPVNIGRMAPDGEPTFFSKRTLESSGLSGVTARDKPGMSRLAAIIDATVHPEDGPRMREAIHHALVTGEPYVMKYRRRRADGAYRWMEGRAEPLRDQSGTIVQWYTAAIDIDDGVRAQEALQESQKQLQQIIDAVPANIWSWTPSGQMSYVSKRYLDHLGLETANPEDFVRVSETLVHPDDIAELRHITSNCLRTGEAFVMRYRRRQKGGSYRWVEGRCAPLRDQEGRIAQWYGVSVDVDDQVRSRQELSRAQDNLARASQAASLAQLSASIAHEVAQPLTSVVSSSESCQQWLSENPPNIERANKTLGRILQSANSAVEVVGRIRALFRHSGEMKMPGAIGGVVAEARDLLADDFSRSGTSIEIDVESHLPPVLIDRVQIQQVLINLLRNGIDAMDALTVDKILKVRVHRPGDDAIQVEISDRGHGIENPESIFEPFFTTKQKGMGMGLAICRSIVESHGGRIWAETNCPQGTVFIFTIPIECGPRAATDSVAAPSSLQLGSNAVSSPRRLVPNESGRRRPLHGRWMGTACESTSNPLAASPQKTNSYASLHGAVFAAVVPVRVLEPDREHRIAREHQPVTARHQAHHAVP